MTKGSLTKEQEKTLLSICVNRGFFVGENAYSLTKTRNACIQEFREQTGIQLGRKDVKNLLKRWIAMYESDDTILTDKESGHIKELAKQYDAYQEHGRRKRFEKQHFSVEYLLDHCAASQERDRREFQLMWMDSNGDPQSIEARIDALKAREKSAKTFQETVRHERKRLCVVQKAEKKQSKKRSRE